MREKLKAYYQLTKPGIIYGNLLTTFAGFFLASKGVIHVWLLLATFVGISLAIASACVLNNYIDQGIDMKMERTKKRPLVTGQISGKSAIIFGGVLGILGGLVLFVFVNVLTPLLGLIACIVYIALYGFAKRNSIHSTLVGSISGAMPPVAGYTAVTNSFDKGAIILFLILTIWQMPHFYAIAIYRLKEYKNAGIPVLPVVKGIFATKMQILIYAILFLIPIIALAYFGYAGWIYLVVMLALAVVWIWQALKGFCTTHTDKWARKMFFLSLIIITIFSIIVPVDVIIRNGLLVRW